MGGRIYKSLEEVIERYKNEQIVEGFYLQIPVFKSIEDEFIQTNNDMIYTTIRESRETQLLKSQSFIRFKGFLYKKSSKNSSKKWKKLFFVLNSKESILYYYLSETRTKPKGLIDLQYSYLYSIHDSLFERQNCFQIVERALPCISTIYYLSSNDLELSQEWVQVLKPFCLRQMNSFIKSKAYEMKSIYLSLICGQNISLKLSPNPFIYLTFNGSIVKVGKSQIKSAPNPQYEEEFILDDIPIDVQTFHLILCNQSKHKKVFLIFY
jgi:Ras GTPase-activating protein 1